MIRKILVISTVSLALVAAACSSTDKKEEPVKPVVVEPPKTEPPKKEEPVVATRSVDTGAVVEAQNEKLAKVPVLGLPPFESGKKVDSYGKASLDAAKAAVADMPEGYVLQITGHHNQHPDKSKRKGYGLSQQRAKQIYDYFVKNGIPKEKLSYRGVGSSENDKSLTRAQNRRVTFRIVKAGEADETPAPKPKPKTEVKPKPEIKPEAAKPDTKPDVAPAAAKPDAAPVVAPADAKPEAKPEVAPAEAKPEAKP
ncbi:MAG: OmpA family protein [Spirochaetes bacterium]|nr:OmpA family protein [Spirochaetota bacterium]